jgi:hypothetical protein
MSLQDRLDAFKAALESGKLPFKPTMQQIEAMHRATAELVAGGQARDYTQRPDPSELLPVLDRMRASKAA